MITLAAEIKKIKMITGIGPFLYLPWYWIMAVLFPGTWNPFWPRFGVCLLLAFVFFYTLVRPKEFGRIKFLFEVTVYMLMLHHLLMAFQNYDVIVYRYTFFLVTVMCGTLMSTMRSYIFLVGSALIGKIVTMFYFEYVDAKFEIFDLFLWICSFIVMGLLVDSTIKSRTEILNLSIEANEAAIAREKALKTQMEAEKKLLERDLSVRLTEQANVIKNTFLRNMSHELKTPLTSILGFSELLSSPQTPADEKELYLKTINRNGAQLIGLIDNILSLTELDAGKLDFNLVDFDFLKLVQEVTSEFDLKAKEKELQFSCLIDKDVPRWVHSDPIKLKTILMNVIDNAIKFTPQGFVTIHVSQLEASKIKVAVEDSGIGIAKEQTEKLFRLFTQADESLNSEFGGTGLGLIFSQKLARVLGGDIVLKSSVLGRGSIFEITFENRAASAGVSS